MIHHHSLGAMQIPSEAYNKLINDVADVSQFSTARVVYVNGTYNLRNSEGKVSGQIKKGAVLEVSDFTTELPGMGEVKYRIIFKDLGTDPAKTDKGSPKTDPNTGTALLIADSGLSDTPPTGTWSGYAAKGGTQKRTQSAGINPGFFILAYAAYYYFARKPKR